MAGSKHSSRPTLPPPVPGKLAAERGSRPAWPARKATRSAFSALLVLSALASYALLFHTDSFALVPQPAPASAPWQRPDVPYYAAGFDAAGNASARPPAYLVRAAHGAAATENELCSRAGVAAMKAGGNAVDAAVAATLCIGVVSMFS
jgi:hypothetical protein